MKAMIAAFVVSLACTWLVTPLVERLARRQGALAVPRERDVHTHPTPRWGGLAIIIGVLAAITLTVSYRHLNGDAGWNREVVGILLAGAFIAVVGLVDDVRDLRALHQALAIMASGLILVAFGVRIQGLTNPFVESGPGSYNPASWIALPYWASVLLTLFWVFVVTKTIDAIDGLDGLAAGVCAISGSTLALMAAAAGQPTIALLAAAVVGACIGFLRHNYAPARIFMGTVGAQFLGLMLAAVSMMGTVKVAAAISVFVPVLVLGVPIFDYMVVLARRVLQRAPLTAADRRHFHHRLLDRGLTDRQAVWVIYGCTAVLCSAALLLFGASR